MATDLDMGLDGHTPGPWVAATAYSSVVGLPVVASSGRSIASVTYFGKLGESFGNHHRESLANARLISAAPDMLAALVKMRDLLRKLQPALNTMAQDVMDDIIAGQIDPAIAAATQAPSRA